MLNSGTKLIRNEGVRTFGRRGTLERFESIGVAGFTERTLKFVENEFASEEKLSWEGRGIEELLREADSKFPLSRAGVASSVRRQGTAA